MIEIEVKDNQNDQKLSRIINSFCKVPYGLLQKLFRLKKISVNNEKINADCRVYSGDVIKVYTSIDVCACAPEVTDSIASDRLNKLISMKIYENDYFIAINKPARIPVQGGSKISLSIEDLIKSYKQYDCKLVHRLDRDTSGVLLIAKGLVAARKLAFAFKNNEVTKKYLAITSGIPSRKNGIIKCYLKKTLISNEEKVVIVDKLDSDGKFSETEYNVLKCFRNKALIELMPKTGRTHQLRVHCADILGAPILGDRKYGDKEKNNHMYLHAQQISIPSLDINISSELPEYFQKEMSEMVDINNQSHLTFLVGSKHY